MKLLRDPHQWALSAVGSRTRFGSMVILYIVIVGLTIQGAIDGGWRSSMGPLVFLTWFQLLQLYALRQLALSIDGTGRPADAP